MRNHGCWAVALFTLLALAGCSSDSDHERDVSRAEFDSAGKTWPLTVNSGKLTCNANAVTIETGGTVYAVNGTAKGRSSGADIASIWSDDPNAAGLKLDISDLVSEGLTLC